VLGRAVGVIVRVGEFAFATGPLERLFPVGIVERLGLLGLALEVTARREILGFAIGVLAWPFPIGVVERLGPLGLAGVAERCGLLARGPALPGLLKLPINYLY
jgi:hypothetical protein